jgi:hypothetical protein
MAPGCSVVFSRREKSALIAARLSTLPKLAGVTPASRLEVRPAPEVASSGIAEIDALTGGLPRGCLTEICGPASSGRTSVLLAALAAATRRQEVCALVDASDAFHPLSGAAAGVDFEKLLWVRCGTKNSPLRKFKSQTHLENSALNFSLSAAERRQNATHGISRGSAIEPQALKGRQNILEGPLEQALRATDLLLQSGGFGMVLMDLGDIPFQSARRIPLTTWFRFQRAVETTPTILFVIAEVPLAQTCASLLLKVQLGKLTALSSRLSGKESPAHTQLLNGLSIEGELLRSRLQRKPAQSVATAFNTSSFKLKAES